VQLVPRHGKYSAEIYYIDPDTGKRVRKLRATGIRIDGTKQSERTAEDIGRKIEAEYNGLQGVAAARKIRRAGPPITLADAYQARLTDMSLKRRAHPRGCRDRLEGLSCTRYLSPAASNSAWMASFTSVLSG